MLKRPTSCNVCLFVGTTQTCQSRACLIERIGGSGSEPHRATYIMHLTPSDWRTKPDWSLRRGRSDKYCGHPPLQRTSHHAGILPVIVSSPLTHHQTPSARAHPKKSPGPLSSHRQPSPILQSFVFHAICAPPRQRPPPQRASPRRLHLIPCHGLPFCQSPGLGGPRLVACFLRVEAPLLRDPSPSKRSSTENVYTRPAQSLIFYHH